MRVLIIDWFNLIKRYTYSHDLSELSIGEIVDQLTNSILNRISTLMYLVKPDLICICSDSGFNRRAANVVDGYKANRKRQKSLTDKEKETDYIEFLRRLIKVLPFAYVEVKDTEADLVIRCVIHYLTKLNENISITIASSDSDLLQLLSNNVKIYDWYKEDVNLNNWYKKHSISDKPIIKVSDYALIKSIVGDSSDNIKGVNGIGWKKMIKLYDIIYSFFNKEKIEISNVHDLLDILQIVLKKDLTKNDAKFINTIFTLIKENESLVRTNQSVVDLSMLETPYLYKINKLIEVSFFENDFNFNQKAMIEAMKLDRFRDSVGSGEYEKIVEKNLKSSMMFKYLSWKSKKLIQNLRKER